MVRFYRRDLRESRTSNAIRSIIGNNTFYTMLSSKDPIYFSGWYTNALIVPTDPRIGINILYSSRYGTIYDPLIDINYQEVSTSLIRKFWEF